MWKLYQYRSIVTDFYAGCDEDTRDAIEAYMDILQERGNQCRRPISRALEDGLFELRPKSARFIYFFRPGKEAVFVVAVHKDQRTLRRDYFDQAKRRRKEILFEEVMIYGVSFPNQSEH